MLSSLSPTELVCSTTSNMLALLLFAHARCCHRNKSWYNQEQLMNQKRIVRHGDAIFHELDTVFKHGLLQSGHHSLCFGSLFAVVVGVVLSELKLFTIIVILVFLLNNCCEPHESWRWGSRDSSTIFRSPPGGRKHKSIATRIMVPVTAEAWMPNQHFSSGCSIPIRIHIS